MDELSRWLESLGATIHKRSEHTVILELAGGRIILRRTSEGWILALAFKFNAAVHWGAKLKAANQFNIRLALGRAVVYPDHAELLTVERLVMVKGLKGNKAQLELELRSFVIHAMAVARELKALFGAPDGG